MTTSIDDSRPEEILLSTATEDHHGLYEAVWELNSRFPDASLSEKYRAANSALLSLSAAGHIELYQQRVDGEEQAISVLTAPVADLLANPVSWYPEHQGVQVGFVATEAGRESYFSKDGAAV